MGCTDDELIFIFISEKPKSFQETKIMFSSFSFFHTHLITTVHPCHALRKTNQAFQLADCDPPRWFSDSWAVPLSQTLVLLHNEFLRLLRDLIAHTQIETQLRNSWYCDNATAWRQIPVHTKILNKVSRCVDLNQMLNKKHFRFKHASAWIKSTCDKYFVAVRYFSQ